MAFQVLHSLDEWAERFGAASQKTVLTVGNFDGVHLGHQQILRRVVERARAVGALAAAVTFDPHPMKVLRPADAPPLICAFGQRLTGLEAAGIEAVLVARFDLEFSKLSPERFVTQILVDRLRPVAIVVGNSFRFGCQQAGDVHLLAQLGRQVGFEVDVVPPVVVRETVVSSTAIRQSVREGRISEAGRLLGRPFSLSGQISRGSGTGRRRVVPTLNLAREQELLPKRGVYATETRLRGGRYRSVTNVGLRPTFNGHQWTIESHLFDFEEEVASGEMQVDFWHRLRDEHKFAGPAALRAQVLRDCERARAFFRRLDRLSEARRKGLRQPA